MRLLVGPLGGDLGSYLWLGWQGGDLCCDLVTGAMLMLVDDLCMMFFAFSDFSDINEACGLCGN